MAGRFGEGTDDLARVRPLDRLDARREQGLRIAVEKAKGGGGHVVRIRCGRCGQDQDEVGILRRLKCGGKVSLTVSLRFQDPERTLTSEEVQHAVDGVVRDLRTAGLEIRGE